MESIFLHLKTTLNKKIALNLNRFKNEPTDYNHSYINLIGILESLLTGNDSGELRFRFSLNMNHILKNSIKSETEINIKIGRELYDIRSQLVHIGESKKFSVDKYLLLRKITQEILLWFVLNPKYDVEDSLTNHLNLKLR